MNIFMETVAWSTDDRETDKSATTYDASVAERWRNKGWEVVALYEKKPLPHTWMNNLVEVKELLAHLEDIAWQPDFEGNPVCVDQAAAMSADVIKTFLIPRLI